MHFGTSLPLSLHMKGPTLVSISVLEALTALPSLKSGLVSRECLPVFVTCVQLMLSKQVFGHLINSFPWMQAKDRLQGIQLFIQTW